MRKQTRVPTSRFSRMLRMGRMAGSVASGVIGEGVKRLAEGNIPSAPQLLLTSGNTQRIANQLAEMRGAAMKIGQLLSMEAGDILPKELTDILAQLRENAHAMPHKDVEKILEREWGAHWRDHFASFEEDSFAAASIGQVHKAVLNDGTPLAIKIQYPGIADSIDSDVSNAASLLRILRIIPDTLDIGPLLETAKLQLKDEANYLLEADYLKKYAELMDGYEGFQVPRVIDTLTTPHVLAMTFLEGESIESVAHLEPEQRNALASQLIDLSLTEFLSWGVVQTDPNFANFRFDPENNRLGLLDFGAIRINETERTNEFRQLILATLKNDLADIVDAACRVGYIQPDDPFNYRIDIADLIKTAAEPALESGAYDFGSSNLAQRMSEKLYRIRSQSDFQRIPPADVIFLHRKLAGLYLLCARIKAQVDVRKHVTAVLAA